MLQQWKEPSTITQGDTVSFKRKFDDYLATDGWSLIYALRGNGQDIQFTSTADSTDHKILVPAATTQNWLPADYRMDGWVTNGTERYQIYGGSLTIQPNLQTAPVDLDVRTHAQKMLASIEGQLEQCAQNILLSTTVEGTMVVREQRNQLLKLRQAYLQERRGEVAAENARNGKPTGRKIKTFLAIMPPGFSGIRQFGAGSVYGNFEAP